MEVQGHDTICVEVDRLNHSAGGKNKRGPAPASAGFKVDSCKDQPHNGDADRQQVQARGAFGKDEQEEHQDADLGGFRCSQVAHRDGRLRELRETVLQATANAVRIQEVTIQGIALRLR